MHSTEEHTMKNESLSDLVDRIKSKKVLDDNDIYILNEHTEYRFFGRVRRA